MKHSDDYRPRPNDHLVEPIFGGLRDAAGERGPDAAVPASPPTASPRPSLLQRLTALLHTGRARA